MIIICFTFKEMEGKSNTFIIAARVDLHFVECFICLGITHYPLFKILNRFKFIFFMGIFLSLFWCYITLFLHKI
jgi:type IV secretory pathway TrbL component